MLIIKLTLKHACAIVCRINYLLYAKLCMCDSAVLIFAKGNHQYEYSTSYVTLALNTLYIAINGQLLTANS